MPKRITILDPNGLEVTQRGEADPEFTRYGLSEPDDWEWIVRGALDDFGYVLKRQPPKLGTYTVTVKEVE